MIMADLTVSSESSRYSGSSVAVARWSSACVAAPRGAERLLPRRYLGARSHRQAGSRPTTRAVDRSRPGGSMLDHRSRGRRERSGDDWEQTRTVRAEWPIAEIDQPVLDRAFEVQARLAEAGLHRSIKIGDLIIAAAAEHAELVVL